MAPPRKSRQASSRSQIRDAVVLVGGLGTRLRPLTLKRPKQMLPVAGRPMIELVLAKLHNAGITKAVLSLGYKPDAFIEAYPDGICSGVELSYAVESAPLDTAGAIKFAVEEAGAGDTFLAVNGDVICEANLKEFFQVHFDRRAMATLLTTTVEDPSQYGVVVTDEDLKVTDFQEKPDPSEGYGNKINAGMYVLNREVLDLIEPGKSISIEKEIFPKILKKGGLFSYLSDEYWIDAGTPETYLQVQMDAAEKLGEHVVSKDAAVHKSAKISNSYIGANVEVAENVEISNSAVLEDVRIEKNVFINQSILGYGSSIGEGCELADFCIIAEQEKIAPNTKLKSYRGPAAKN